MGVLQIVHQLLVLAYDDAGTPYLGKESHLRR